MVRTKASSKLAKSSTEGGKISKDKKEPKVKKTSLQSEAETASIRVPSKRKTKLAVKSADPAPAPAASKKRVRQAGKKKAQGVVEDDKSAVQQAAADIEPVETAVSAPEVAAEPEPSQRKKSRSAQKPATLHADDDENAILDEDGSKLPLPAKHGSPIHHSRPRVVRRSLPWDTEGGAGAIELVIQPLSSSGNAMPPAAMKASPETTVAGLRDIIYSNCHYLPPEAQILYRKAGSDFVKLEDASASLASLGILPPGPQDIYLEVALDILLSAHPDSTPASPAASPLSAGAADAGGAEDAEDGSHEALPKPAAIHHRPEATSTRRSNKRWSEEEVEWLLLGLLRFGISSWTKIAERWNFQDRTTVDLKDKWRNLVKNVRDGRLPRGSNLSEENKKRIFKIMYDNGIPISSYPTTATSPQQTTSPGALTSLLLTAAPSAAED